MEQCCMLPIGGTSDTDLCTSISDSRTLSVWSHRLGLTNALWGRINELMACISYDTSLHLLPSVIYLLSSSHGSTWPKLPHYLCFEITIRYTILGMTPLDEWPAHSRDLSTWQHPTFTWTRRDSNLQSQRARGRRPTPLNRAATGTSASFQTKIILRKSLISIQAEVHEPGFTTL